MSQTAHTLSWNPTLNTDQLRLERRRWNRRPVEACMTAVYRTADRRGVTPLTIVDMSLDGLGAISATELEPGTRISVCASAAPVPARSGTVVRCIADHGKFEIGVRLDAKLCA